MRKLVFIFSFGFIFSLFVIELIAQDVSITYPQKIDSYKNQVLNIPIVCENKSNNSITLLPDFLFDIKGYQINNISPKSIAPFDKEMIFISIIPEDYLIAGNRFIPFTLRDISGKINAEGVFEIQHHIDSGLEIIPIDTPRFLIPDISYSLSFFIRNIGSVPIEISFQELEDKFLLNPAESDTILVDIKNLDEEVWYNLNLEYNFTLILPTGLDVSYNTYRQIIPIAQKNDLKDKDQFNILPMNVSQKFYYDKTSNYNKYFFRQHTTSVSGFGYIRDYPSPLIGWYINHKYNIYNQKTDNDETNFNVFYKSKNLNITAGDGSYKLDLNRLNKYGQGYDIALKFNNFILQQTFLKEQYKDRPVHTLNAFGYTWEIDQYQYEPLQYVMFKYYRKYNRFHNNNWYSLKHHESIENEKYVANLQFKPIQNLLLNLELFTVKDSTMDKLSSPNYAGEAIYQNSNLFYRFYALKDNSNLLNEFNYRYRLNNEVNLYTDKFDVYASYLYYDEKAKSNWTNKSHTSNQNYYVNAQLNILPELYLKSRFYSAETNVYYPNKSNFNENEFLYGFFIKNKYTLAEVLCGQKIEKYLDTKRWNLYEFNMNFFVNSTFSLLINNQVAHRKEKQESKDINHTKISSSLQANIKWNHNLIHSLGINHTYYNQNIWQNYLFAFTDLTYTFKWGHSLKSGVNYGLNPRISDVPGISNSYRFSCYVEYVMPIEIPLSRKNKSKIVNISLFDPWYQKPVSGAIFNYDNMYYISNEKGYANIKRTHNSSDLMPSQLSIINMPDGFATLPNLTDVSASIKDKKVKSVQLNLVHLSELNIQLMLKKYDKISMDEVNLLPDKDYIAYQNKNLINLNQYQLIPFNKNLTFTLSNGETSVSVKTNNAGFANVKNLYPGTWSIAINNKDVKLQEIGALVIENNADNIILEYGDKLDYQIIFLEKYQKFIKFDID